MFETCSGQEGFILLDDYDDEESLEDDEDSLDDDVDALFEEDDYELGDHPGIDESFLDEDLLDDPYEDDSITDEYDEEYLNEEGFYIEKQDLAEETPLYKEDESFDFDD